MRFEKINTPDADLERLIAQAIVQYTTYGNSTPARWLLVDVAGQRLVFLRDNTPTGVWPVSTAAAGIDNHQDSGGTPPGVHRIAEKIGAGCPTGTIFVDRRDTGRVWPADPAPAAGADLILTRILTLAGCEPGLNQGPGVDSRERFIYLHGTNDEAHIGTPVSHGCVRLTNAAVQEVFELINEGDPVVII